MDSEFTEEQRTTLDRIDEWQHDVAPYLDQAISDQQFRAYVRAKHDKQWRVWAIRLSVIVAGITIIGSLARTFVEGLRLFGLR